MPAACQPRYENGFFFVSELKMHKRLSIASRLTWVRDMGEVG